MNEFSPGREFPPATREQWEEKARASLKGKPVESLVARTIEGIEIAPVHDGPASAPVMVRPAPLARERGWAVMQRIDLPESEAAAAQAKAELDAGADGLVLVLPGSPSAGGFGLSDDGLTAVLEGLEPELFPLRLDAGQRWRATAEELLNLYRTRRYDLARAPLMLNADPFGSMAAAGGGPEKNTLAEEMAALMARALKDGFTGNVFAADTRVFHAAGAGEAQELAIAAAAMTETMRLVEGRGIDLEGCAKRISWLLTADADQFLTIAKLRAARMIHGRILAAAGLPARPLLLQAESAWRMMTRRDPYVNMLRGASAAFGAGLGGADAMTVLPFAAAIGLADDFARRMARNAQIIALEESGLDRVSDPAAGSGYVEALSESLARAAWRIFQDIEAAGGLYDALLHGRVQALIAETAQRRSQAIARREIPIT